MFIKFGSTGSASTTSPSSAIPSMQAKTSDRIATRSGSACSPARKSLHASIPKAAPSSFMPRYSLRWKVERKSHSAATRAMRAAAPAAGHAGLQGAHGKARVAWHQSRSHRRNTPLHKHRRLPKTSGLQVLRYIADAMLSKHPLRSRGSPPVGETSENRSAVGMLRSSDRRHKHAMHVRMSGRCGRLSGNFFRTMNSI